MYFINEGEHMNIERVLAYIEDFKANDYKRLAKNKRYYDCKNDSIMNRTFSDSTKPNNKYTSSWAKYITTLISGYFMGKPITYWSENKELMEIINSNLEYDVLHNQEIARDTSIYGIGCEILYLDSDKNVKYKRIDPTSVIPIYSCDIEKELLYVIRFWNHYDVVSKSEKLYIDVHSKESITSYVKDIGGIAKINELINPFKMVNINIFYNNADGVGDAEPVLKLIDGYDFALSDTANFREELNDSYLVFKNTNLDSEDVIQMKQKRIISIEDTEQGMASSVNWLNKDSNDAEQENYKQRLADDIKKFSFVADIETAKSHTTATSAKIGLLGIEQVCVDKECQFRKAILNRLKLICSIENTKGNLISSEGVTLTFVRNIPIDLSVIGDTIVKLAPFVSKRTLLSQIPFISNVDGELEQKAQEDLQNTYDVNIFKEDSFNE